MRVFYTSVRCLFCALAAFCAIVFTLYPYWGMVPLLVIGGFCLLLAQESRP